MKDRVITIFGGSGFVGSHVVKHLAPSGALINVVSRRPGRADYLKTAGQVGQISLIYTDITNEELTRSLIASSDVVINLVGLLFEKGSQRFSAVHAQAAEHIAKCCTEYNVSRLIHMSALGVDDNGHSLYARTKFNGEKAVLKAFPAATIMRPSIIFGPEDNFFNQFAQMASFLPFLPAIGGGTTKFQPVYVGDVATAVAEILKRPETQGQIIEMGGPKVYSFHELLSYMLSLTKQQAWLVPVPMPIASFIGALAELLPTPPLTRDQVKLLRHDNILCNNKEGVWHLKDLDIHPASIEAILPSYMHRFAYEYVREI